MKEPDAEYEDAVARGDMDTAQMLVDKAAADAGLPDWTDGYDISDYIDENDLDYDSIILDEGGDLLPVLQEICDSWLTKFSKRANRNNA